MRQVSDVTLFGTGKVGEIEATFDELQRVFGAPEITPAGDGDGKTRANWWLRSDDGTVASIYDWKESTPLEALTTWHVGGRTHEALAHVLQALKDAA